MYISPTNLLHYLLNFHIPHVKSKCESVIITVGLLHYLLNFHIPHVKSKCESVIITVGCDEASYSIINNYYDAFQSV